MESLQLLEEKIRLLLEARKRDADRVAELQTALEGSRAQIVKLEESNAQYKEQLAQLSDQLLERHDASEELAKERADAKKLVDELISSIDLLVGHES